MPAAYDPLPSARAELRVAEPSFLGWLLDRPATVVVSDGVAATSCCLFDRAAGLASRARVLPVFLLMLATRPPRFDARGRWFAAGMLSFAACNAGADFERPGSSARGKGDAAETIGELAGSRCAADPENCQVELRFRLLSGPASDADELAKGPPFSAFCPHPTDPICEDADLDAHTEVLWIGLASGDITQVSTEARFNVGLKKMRTGVRGKLLRSVHHERIAALPLAALMDGSISVSFGTIECGAIDVRRQRPYAFKGTFLRSLSDCRRGGSEPSGPWALDYTITEASADPAPSATGDIFAIEQIRIGSSGRVRGRSGDAQSGEPKTNVRGVNTGSGSMREPGCSQAEDDPSFRTCAWDPFPHEARPELSLRLTVLDRYVEDVGARSLELSLRDFLDTAGSTASIVDEQEIQEMHAGRDTNRVRYSAGQVVLSPRGFSWESVWDRRVVVEFLDLDHGRQEVMARCVVGNTEDGELLWSDRSRKSAVQYCHRWGPRTGVLMLGYAAVQVVGPPVR